MSFQRKGPKSLRKKIRRRSKITCRKILFFFVLTAALFFIVQQTCFLLYQWKTLNVKEIKITCLRSTTRETAERLIRGQVLGNILLLDTGRLRDILAEYAWIRTVQIRKILPNTLEINIEERTPVALLKEDAFHLIDKEGIVLESLGTRNKTHLPLLVDGGNFEKNRKEKIGQAINLLRSLKTEDRDLIDVIDLSEPFNIKAILKEQRLKLILGKHKFSERLDRYRSLAAGLKQKFGKLEYIDLRFDDRIYLKPLVFPSQPTENLSVRRSDHAEE
ncbi:MAG: FtsQ-type POTRA domain-containing protein [Candidatus Aminicenantes bacterium]|nr:FtsQ-type POTRA domain-containing protein [Candidatus Aminicenantes bacterium]